MRLYVLKCLECPLIETLEENEVLFWKKLGDIVYMFGLEYKLVNIITFDS